MGYREEDHLSAAVWNIFCIIDHEERIRLGYLDPKFDDMGETPRYVPLNEEGDCK